MWVTEHTPLASTFTCLYFQAHVPDPPVQPDGPRPSRPVQRVRGYSACRQQSLEVPERPLGAVWSSRAAASE